MGSRKVVVKQSVADSIAEIAWFIESKGLGATAENFSDEVYDYLKKLRTRSVAILCVVNLIEPKWDTNANLIRKSTRLFF